MGLTTRWRAVTGAVAMAFVAAACGGSDGGQRADRERDEAATIGLDDDAALAAAEAWLDDWDRLDADGRSSLDLVGTRRSPGGLIHVRFGQIFNGTPVRDAAVIVHLDENGDVLGASDALTDARPPADVEQQVDEDQARGFASDAAPSAVEEVASARVVWLPDGDQLRLGWSVRMDTAEGGYQVWVDAVTGEVADASSLVADSGPAAPTQQPGCNVDESDAPVACVEQPDPVRSGGDRTAFPLDNLDVADGSRLVGDFADTENGLQPVEDADGVWDLDRGDPGYEQLMAYLWTDFAQQALQRLGFEGILDTPVPVFPLDESEVDNAFFDTQNDEMHLGVMTNGESTADDASIILHEYGHGILDAQVPVFPGGAEFGAYHEGWGDLLAYTLLLGLAPDPACVGPWFAVNVPEVGGDCLRRVDEELNYPDDLVGEVHFDSLIFSAAVSDAVEGLLDADGLTIDDCEGTNDCDDVRDRVLTTMLTAHELLTGFETMPEIGVAYLAANDAVFGTDEAVWVDAFAAHGLEGDSTILTDSDGDKASNDGELIAQVTVRHPFIGDLEVLLGVVDVNGTLLCTPVRLHEPSQDPTDNLTIQVDLTGTECGALGEPSLDAIWVVQVTDSAALDVGRIDSFSIESSGRRFLADELPVPIPDNDPDGAIAFVSG